MSHISAREVWGVRFIAAPRTPFPRRPCPTLPLAERRAVQPGGGPAPPGEDPACSSTRPSPGSLSLQPVLSLPEPRTGGTLPLGASGGSGDTHGRAFLFCASFTSLQEGLWRSQRRADAILGQDGSPADGQADGKAQGVGRAVGTPSPQQGRELGSPSGGICTPHPFLLCGRVQTLPGGLRHPGLSEVERLSG